MIPTAGGKTPLLSTICRDAVQLWDGRVLILAHVKELLEQAVDKLRAVAPDLRIGVYSAGLNRRDTQHAVIVAGIQSVYKRACELDAFDLVIVDECHLIPEEGDGMYRQFLTDARKVNPNLRVIGLTATPYRMKSGLICGPDNILNEVCYEVGIRELIRDGYLCPLVTKAGRQKADTSELHIRGGEFVAGELEDLMDQDALVEAACAEIVEQTRARQACLIFASGVRHGQHVASVLAEKHGIECGFVCGDTSGGQRAELLARFRGVPSDGLFERSPLKYLCNVNVLTTGFDAPNVDCVALLRPTMSPGLYYQMVGRGFRLHPGKKDCLVLDFGGNVLRHGPVDQIRVRERDGDGGEAPVKECPACHSLVAAGYASCPDCGHELPPVVLRDYRSLWGVKWRVHERFAKLVIDDVIYTHGDSGRGGQDAALAQARDNFQSTVIGHWHAQAGVRWWANRNRRVFGMAVGCGIDNSALQFAYGRAMSAKPLLGCGVVLHGERAVWEPWLLPAR